MTDPDPPESWAARFSTTARAVASGARSLGLAAPGFRSPPAVEGVDRTLRRYPDGRCIVAVRVLGRDFAAVLADLVEGVIATNHLEGDAAANVRRELTTLVMRQVRAA